MRTTQVAVRAACRGGLALVASIWFMAAGCSGTIGNPVGIDGDWPNRPGGPGAAGSDGSSGRSTAPNDRTNPPNEPGSDPSASGAFEPAPAALRKLTVEQYKNSVSDLLGSGLKLPAELEPDTAQNGFYAIGASKATISPAAAEKFEQAAYDLAAQALAPARRAALVGCTPKAAVDPECARQFLTKLGARAFRRPLTEAETTRYLTIANDSAKALGDFHAGLEFAVAGLLQSPLFLFRVELGEADPANPTRLRYTDHELASRLSYMLWNTTPDAALLEAAGRKELTTAAGLQREIDRLIADVRTQKALDNFHAERLGLAELAALDKADSVFMGLNDDLRNALRDDLLRTIAEYAAPDRDFLALFEGNVAFVTPALATIYGVKSSAAGLTRIELPASSQRTGILGKAGFLALNAHSNETSPTLRGKYIRERLLCESIGAPPPNVVPVLAEPDPNAPTMRDRLKAHAQDVVCNACHSQMDPLGLALEHFDAIGRYRADDHGHALDTTGDLDGQRFDGLIELSALLREDPRTADCVARQVYRYATAHVETDGEASQIEGLVAQFRQSGNDFPTLLRAVVKSEGFRFAAKER